MKSIQESDVQESTGVKALPVIIKFANIYSRSIFHVKHFAFTKNDTLKLSHIGIDSDNRIFINENLSKHNLDLLRRAKKFKKNGKITAAYSYDGMVCVYHRKDDKKHQILYSVDD